jgi:hypothetical protein
MSNDGQAEPAAQEAVAGRFSRKNFATKLRVPEGTPYVEGSTIEQIKAAIRAGYAVYGEGCDGRVFLWATEEGYEADHFFFGPANPHHFDDLDEAADFAAGLCE